MRVLKRFHPPGTAPGTLRASGEAATAPTSLVLVRYDGEHLEERSCGTVDEVAALVKGGATHWLRIVGHDPAVLEGLGKCFGVHALVLEDVHNTGQRPKAEEYPTFLFIVVQVVRRREDDEPEDEQVALILFKDLLISIEERENALFQPVVDRLRGARGRIRVGGPDYLAYALLDTVVDCLFPVLDRLGERMEDVEDALLESPDRRALLDLQEIKRELMHVRRVSWPTRELMASLTRLEEGLVQSETRVYLRDVYDHIVQALDVVENFRDVGTNLMDLYLSSVSNRMNEIMKVLTLIATIFIPLTFIAGLYGMNFNTQASPYNMPELNWPYAYPVVLGIMGAVALAMLLFFHRKGWL
jgi:magnesium transporter